MREKVRSWFFSSGRLQVFSVVIALIAWFVVHSGQTVQQRVEFRVEYVNIPSHLIFKKDPPTSVRVLLTGSFHRVRSMSADERTYQVDLSQARAGLNTVDVDLSNLRLPLDVFASNPVPRRLDFQIEELHRKELPVQVVFTGKLPENYMVSDIRVIPNPIQVVGPASALEGLQDIKLSVSLEGRNQSFSTSILVDIGLPQVKTVDSALVEVDISRLSGEREMIKVPVSVDVDPQNVIVTPPEARLVLRGVEDKLSQAQPKVLIPVQGLRKGRYRVRAEVQLEEGLQLVRMEPESFIVEVKE